MDYPPLDFISQSIAKLTFLFVGYKKVCNKTNQKISYSQFSQAVGCEDNYLSKFIFERYNEYEWNDFFQFVIIICFFPGDWFIRYVASFIGIEHDRQELDLNEVTALTSLLGISNLLKRQNEKPLEFPISIIKFEHLLAETENSIFYLKSLQSSVTNYIFENTKRACEIYQRRKKVNYKRVYVENHNGELPPLSCSEIMKKLFSKNHQNPYIFDYEISGSSEKETLYLVLTYYRNKFSNLCRIKKSRNSSGVTTTTTGNASSSKSTRSLNKSITHLIAQELSSGIPNSSTDYNNIRVSPSHTSPNSTTTINTTINSNNNNPNNNSLYTGIKKTTIVPISYRAQTASTGCSSRAVVNLDPFNENNERE